MKEEMQGFHMTRNYKIFIIEITWLNHLYTFNWIYPRKHDNGGAAAIKRASFDRSGTRKGNRQGNVTCATMLCARPSQFCPMLNEVTTGFGLDVGMEYGF